MLGTDSSCAIASSRNCARRPRSAYFACGISRSTSTRRSAGNPMSTDCRRRTLRISRPAAATTVTASATCATTSVRRPCRADGPATPRAPPLRSWDTRSALHRQQCRGETGQQRRHEGDRDGGHHDRRIYPDGFDARQSVRHKGDQRLETPPGDRKTHGPGRERQHEAFDEQLTHERAASGAECGADR